MQALFRIPTVVGLQRRPIVGFVKRVATERAPGAWWTSDSLTRHRSLSTAAQFATMASIQYPKPKRSDVKDVLHGKTIEDPYRWMEDPDAKDTKEFVDAQNNITKKFLEACPNREQLREQLTKLWNFPKFGVPFKRGEYYYFMQNDGLQNQYVLCRMKSLKDKPEVFLDPNLLSSDGTVALTESTFSQGGKYYCYGLSERGSDWSTLHVKDVSTMKDLPEKIERFRYSCASWTKDEQGFFYGQYPDFEGKVCGTEAKAVENQKLFYHRLNTTQDKDILCIEFPDKPQWMIAPVVSECGKYLVLSVSESCKDNRVYVADISGGVNGVLELKCLYDKFDCEMEYVTNDDSVFYFRTNKNRPNYGIVKVDLTKPENWVEVIPQHEKDVLDWVCCVDKDKLVVSHMKDVVSVVSVHELATGKLIQTLPFGIGTVEALSAKRKHSEVFFMFETFTTPGIVYRCEIDKAPNASLEEYKRIQVPGTSTDNLSPQQVFYESKDGTKVPMFIVRDKDAPLDGTAPCLLYVYGGFNAAIQPYFSIFRLMLLKALGFTTVIANVRGGGEYGEKWHNAGRLKNKQNTFDDVHAAARYLVDHKYTSSNRLVLMGGSNGGMVTTASINQRPELFGAAVAQVPVTDMFRFHKFTVGKHWSSDYGNPDVADDFAVQAAYSPLHNIPTGIDNYPSVLVVTADHDDRVVPSHSLKYIAELQYRLGEKNKKPLLALIDTKAGHGSGKPTAKVIDELVDIMCFLQRELNLKYTE